jgi:alkylhydroperoxidase/carboxymuconolactone decarboxylase family protein YurZ
MTAHTRPMEATGRLAALRAAVLDGPGVTDRELRRAAATGTAPGGWADHVRAVRETSYRVSEEDIAALKAAGLGEEEIFEVTVATAVGAAFDRFETGLRALAES